MNSSEEIIHYNETVINKVEQATIFPYIDDELKKNLISEFEDSPIPTWRLMNNSVNRSKFEKIQPGDEILIVEEDIIRFIGKISAKTINVDLSKKLWFSFENDSHEELSLVIFMRGLISINLAFEELSKLFGYGEDWIPEGLTMISENKLKEFSQNHDSLYKVLREIKDNELF